MADIKEIIEKARAWALEEIDKNQAPMLPGFNLSNEKGQELAEKLGANKDVVLIGTMLMDVKLGECINGGKLPEHVQRSVDATKQFLKQFDLDEEIKEKIINCVEAHHGTKEYICKEAEICANADCYRFLWPSSVFNAIKLYGLDLVSEKLEEKWAVLSIDICKQELEEYYQMFKKLFEAAKG